jgi:hypothetical protein
MYSGNHAVFASAVLIGIGARVRAATESDNDWRSRPIGSGGPAQNRSWQRLAEGKLRAVNREVTKLPEPRDGVRVSEKSGRRRGVD